MEIKLTLDPTSTGHVEKVELYSGGCTSFTLVGSVAVDSLNDTLLVLEVNSLVVGDHYFIKLSTMPACTRCQETAVYDLCLTEPLSPRIICTVNGGALCQMANECGDPPIAPGGTMYKDCEIEICVNTPTVFDFSGFSVGPGLYPTNTLDFYFPFCDIGPFFHYDVTSTSVPTSYTATWSTAGDYVVEAFHYDGNPNNCGGIYYLMRYTIHVVDNPVASLTASAGPYCENGIVCFTSTSTGQNLNYNWFSSYGTCSSGCTDVFCTNPIGSGPVGVTLTVSNACGPNSVSQTISAFPPVANFSSVTNCQTTFTDLSTCQINIVSWAWTFGDGITSSLQNPTHTYATAGTYTVTLTTTDINGYTSASCVLL